MKTNNELINEAMKNYLPTEKVKSGLKLVATDGTKIEIIRDGFKKDGFNSVEVAFLSGRLEGKTETMAVAFLQEAYAAGHIK